MGVESPEDRRARFQAWWSTLGKAERQHAVRSGHARPRLPEAEPKSLTPNQRKAARRRERGK